MFFSQSSFDMVYLEAVANALDAGASKIHIHFSASTLSNIKSFHLTISDNGIGFTDERYTKFCRLLEVDKDDKTHRGLGRLVYLFYFDNVKVISHYNGNQYREFNFDKEFGADAPNNSSTLDSEHESGSTNKAMLPFSGAAHDKYGTPAGKTVIGWLSLPGLIRH